MGEKPGFIIKFFLFDSGRESILYFVQCICICYIWLSSDVVSTEQPPPRSWVHLKEPDRTRPAGGNLSHLNILLFIIFVTIS